jgi:hypothetical protein
MSDIDYSKFPFISTHDFEYVEIDALKFDEEEYVAMLNFFKADPYQDDSDEPIPVQGFSLDTAIFGESLEDIFDSVGHLFASGLFNNINVGAHGTLWDANGEIIEPISWMKVGGILDDSDSESVPEEVKPTLH